MADQNTANLRALFVEMAENTRLTSKNCSSGGVKIGPVSIEDIIDREDKAAEGLRKSIETLDKNSG